MTPIPADVFVRQFAYFGTLLPAGRLPLFPERAIASDAGAFSAVFQAAWERLPPRVERILASYITQVRLLREIGDGRQWAWSRPDGVLTFSWVAVLAVVDTVAAQEAVVAEALAGVLDFALAAGTAPSVR